MYDRCPRCPPHEWHGEPCRTQWTAAAWGGPMNQPCQCPSSIQPDTKEPQ